MSTNTENQSGSMDGLKWGLVVILLAASVVGNYYYSKEVSVLFRVIGVVIAVGLAFGVAMLTTKGKAAWTFAKEARTEVRKVVWPTRQEAMQTTLMVIAVSAVVALVLWGLDGLLVRAVSFITGVSI
ncbi:preprotein translocase subunit SecE [Celerinatantimonas sp. MCCC 1A17872]|uniref:preprotein translocase subunit SecE n=1 Tax=Celerinatantimonas sp. MCCC 1A17872 TaxID=3177514 RepID=UPI0038CBD4E6